jgi:hypothetical protein
MADRPGYPAAEDGAGREADHAATSRGSGRAVAAGIVLAVIVVVIFVVLHLTAVLGPGAH